jgi:SAM-dependent methyltransferase
LGNTLGQIRNTANGTALDTKIPSAASPQTRAEVYDLSSTAGLVKNARAGLKAVACEAIRKWHRVFPDFTFLYAGTVEKPGPVFAKEAQFLFALTRILAPKRVLEIGLGGAASTLAFAEALRQNGGAGHLVSIDVSPEAIARANLLLKVHGLRRFSTILHGFSADPATKARAAAMLGQVDLLMIDGDHSFDAVVSDFERYHDLVATAGVILFHDTGPFPAGYADLVERLPREPNAGAPVPTADGSGIYHRPDVARAVDWILEHHPEFSSLSIHAHSEPSCGIAVLQRKRPFFASDGQPSSAAVPRAA